MAVVLLTLSFVAPMHVLVCLTAAVIQFHLHGAAPSVSLHAFFAALCTLPSLTPINLHIVDSNRRLLYCADEQAHWFQTYGAADADDATTSRSVMQRTYVNKRATQSSSAGVVSIALHVAIRSSLTRFDWPTELMQHLEQAQRASPAGEHTNSAAAASARMQ